MPLTNPSHDLALLAAIRKADANATNAFAELYRRHQGPLYRFLLLRTGSADTAADIVQEIFLALLTDNLKFDPTRGALQSFLFGVARNLALKSEEANRRYVSTSTDHTDDGGADETIDSSPAPLERLLASQEAEAVRAALATIAPHYRDVLILYEMHDLSYVDIAQVCGIDIGTVRSRLSRGRTRLAALLAPLRAMPSAVSSSTQC